MPVDKVVRVILNPCAGSEAYPSGHIYRVNEEQESGKEVQDVDFMTETRAREVYGPSGVEVILGGSNGYCIDCVMHTCNLSREEAMEEFPDYKPKTLTFQE